MAANEIRNDGSFVVSSPSTDLSRREFLRKAGHVTLVALAASALPKEARAAELTASQSHVSTLLGKIRDRFAQVADGNEVALAAPGGSPEAAPPVDNGSGLFKPEGNGKVDFTPDGMQMMTSAESADPYAVGVRIPSVSKKIILSYTPLGDSSNSIARFWAGDKAYWELNHGKRTLQFFEKADNNPPVAKDQPRDISGSLSGDVVDLGIDMSNGSTSFYLGDQDTPIISEPSSLVSETAPFRLVIRKSNIKGADVGALVKNPITENRSVPTNPANGETDPLKKFPELRVPPENVGKISNMRIADYQENGKNHYLPDNVLPHKPGSYILVFDVDTSRLNIGDVIANRGYAITAQGQIVPEGSGNGVQFDGNPNTNCPYNVRDADKASSFPIHVVVITINGQNAFAGPIKVS